MAPYIKSKRWATPERIRLLELLAGGDIDAQAIEIAICKKDPWYFLVNHVNTENSHAEINPFQPFPDKPHLFYLTRLWETERRMIVPKSRQMSVTWLFCALYLWESMFFPSRLTVFSSKTEKDAIHLIQRTKFMHERLPKFIREMTPCIALQTELKFKNRSTIHGIPAGADQVRGLTLSGVFVDEGAFQDQMKPMLAAAIPTLGKSGRITLVSSASPSFFQMLMEDQE